MADVWSCQSNVTQHQIHLNTWQQHHTQLASVSLGEISFSSWIKSIWNITNFFTRSAPPSSKSILEITQFYIQSLKEQMLKWSRKILFIFNNFYFSLDFCLFSKLNHLTWNYFYMESNLTLLKCAGFWNVTFKKIFWKTSTDLYIFSNCCISSVQFLLRKWSEGTWGNIEGKLCHLTISTFL